MKLQIGKPEEKEKIVNVWLRNNESSVDVMVGSEHYHQNVFRIFNTGFCCRLRLNDIAARDIGIEVDENYQIMETDK